VAACMQHSFRIKSKLIISQLRLARITVQLNIVCQCHIFLWTTVQYKIKQNSDGVNISYRCFLLTTWF